MPADEVAKTTKLPQIPTDRGAHACPHDGERVYIVTDTEVVVSLDEVRTRNHVTVDGPVDKKSIGTPMKTFCASVPAIAIAVILAVVGATAWMIIFGFIIG